MSADLGEQRLLKGGYVGGGGSGGAAGQQEPENIPCPRCESTNTKFCYYNNYNLSQPRYFCKSCRRYWTRGGTLRNIPVGGGSRKSSKRRSSRPSSSSSSSCATSQPPPPLANGDDHSEPIKTTPLQGPPIVDAPDVNLNEGIPVGSFSSLLGSVQPNNNPLIGLGGYGLGLGFDGLAFGPMTDEPVAGGSADQEPPSECNTWQVGEAEGGMADGGDCFGWPDLAISTPGPARFEYSFWPAN